MSRPSLQPLNSLLKEVSRSFYLTVRILPGAIRPQIGVAYLLARATDTIADTTALPVGERLKALDDLRGRIVGAWERGSLGALESGVALSNMSAEGKLLERIEEILRLLHQFAPADQEKIRQVLDTITSGQALDLERFGGATGDQIVALATEAELEDYTYRVAGCVGEFWTRLCRAHLFPDFPLNEAELLANGVRFGKGLQLVNILRDLPVDLRHGRCYVPLERLKRLGLTPTALLESKSEPAFRPLYAQYLDQAHAHLTAGWAYTNALPRRCVRVRLACGWPILIGVQTLARLRRGNVLDASRRIKISRREMRKVVLGSILCYPSPKAWNLLFHRAGMGA